MTPLVREGTGAGHGIDADLGQAHESAIKEAETDAMKRALMTFGNPFGLALYDKQQRDVTSSATAAPNANSRSRPAEVAPRQQPQSPAQQEKDPSLDPLDLGTIQQILATVRGLPRPVLEEFTKAFRKRFQVPPDALGKSAPIGAFSPALPAGGSLNQNQQTRRTPFESKRYKFRTLWTLSSTRSRARSTRETRY